MHSADLLDEGSRREELLDREPTHQDQELRLEQLELGFDPWPTVRDFIPRRHPIAATARRFSRKAPTDCGHVDALPKPLLVEAERRKPLEQLLPCRPSKRSPELWLTPSRRLPEQEDFGSDWVSDHDRAEHVRATRAGPERLLVSFNQRKPANSLSLAPHTTQATEPPSRMSATTSLSAAARGSARTG